MKPNIALIGKMGSGKTTIANLLADYHGYTRVSLADAVRYVASIAYGPIDYNMSYTVTLPDGTKSSLTGRQVLQRVGTDAIRDNIDKDFWIKALIQRLNITPNGGPWVVDDCRFDNEIRAMQAMGWLTIQVKVNEEARLDRILRLYPEVEPKTLSHSSEGSFTETYIDVAVWNTTPDIAKTVAMLMETAAKRTEQTLMRAKLA